MINYDKCIELQQDALAQLNAIGFNSSDDAHIAIQLLGVVLPVMREVEKILGISLDDAPAIRRFVEQGNAPLIKEP
jgi:hypothetical protein